MGYVQRFWLRSQGWDPGNHQSRRIREVVVCGLLTGTMETNRPVWGWKQLGKLPGGSGTGGLGGFDDTSGRRHSKDKGKRQEKAP